MPTLLKKPITITIAHVENAVATSMLIRDALGKCDHKNYELINSEAPNGEIRNQLDAALAAQGIDWNTWLPEKPFTIGGHEATFNPDGSVTVGCTTVSSAEMDEVIKRRLQTGAKDRFFQYCGDVDMVWKWSPIDGLWIMRRGGNPIRAFDETSLADLEHSVKRGARKELTCAEAAEIVGGEQYL